MDIYALEYYLFIKNYPLPGGRGRSTSYVKVCKTFINFNNIYALKQEISDKELFIENPSFDLGKVLFCYWPE
jgi:hypothetical protein